MPLKAASRSARKNRVISALPATQGIYGFVSFFLLQSMESPAKTFGIGLSVGLVCMLSAIRQGQVCANGIVGVSQGHDNVFGQTLIYAVLPEFYAILGLVCAYLA